MTLISEEKLTSLEGVEIFEKGIVSGKIGAYEDILRLCERMDKEGMEFMVKANLKVLNKK